MTVGYYQRNVIVHEASGPSGIVPSTDGNFLGRPGCFIDLCRFGIEPNPGPKSKSKAKGKKVVITLPKKSQAKKKKAVQKHGGFLSNLGGLVGSAIGGRPGAQLGRTAGSWFGKITGLGDYRVSRNTLMTNGNGPPLFGNPHSGTIITHREFLTDVTGSTAFNLTSYPINVGMDRTFPWLARVAANYEQYELLGMVFEYKPTSAFAVSSTNTALGTVVFATDYDSLDENFTSKQQMEAYEFSTSCSPCNAMIHPIECASRLSTLTNMYVRVAAPPSTGDLRFYDMGKFQIATVGMQAAAVIGELWVSYQVKLLKPKLQTPLGADIQVAHIVESPAGTASNAVGIWGSGLTGRLLYDNIGLTLLGSNTGFVLPNVGRYLILVSVHSGGVAMAANGTITYGSNFSTVATFQNDSLAAAISTASATSVDLTNAFTCQCNTYGTGSANTISYSAPTNYLSGTLDLIVIQLPSNYQSRLSEEKDLEDRFISLSREFEMMKLRRSYLAGKVDDLETKEGFLLAPPNSPCTFAQSKEWNSRSGSSSSSSSSSVSSSNSQAGANWFGRKTGT